MATHTGTEYEVTMRDSDGKVFNIAFFKTEDEADKFIANAGTGEGYIIRKETIDWDEIRNEKYASDY